MTKGHAAALDGLVQAVLPASVWNLANGQLRFLKNLGESYFCSSTKSRLETPGYQLQALAVHSSAKERIQRLNAEVSPSEGSTNLVFIRFAAAREYG